MATEHGQAAPPPPRAIPHGPTVEAWRAMSAAERESFLVQVLDDPTTLQGWLLRALTPGSADEVVVG